MSATSIKELLFTQRMKPWCANSSPPTWDQCRWDGLKEGSINSFKELTRVFGACFVTYSRVPWLLDSLLSMTMQEGETLKTYSDKYWEMFNEIDENFVDVTIRTFKVGLPAEHNLRKYLTRKPAKSVSQLMDRIDENKRVEKDQQQGKGKAKVVPQDWRDFRSKRYNNNHPKRDFARHLGSTAAQVVNTAFQELVHQILDKIKNEPYFRWSNKMVGTLQNVIKVFIVNTNRIEDTLRRNVGLYGIIWSS